jgi:hypothetical protein
MNRPTAPVLLVLLILLEIVCVARPDAAWSQATTPVPPYRPAVEEHQSSLQKLLDALDVARKESSRHQLREGPCEGLYKLPPGLDFVNRDILMQHVDDLKTSAGRLFTELQALHASKSRLEQTLKPITDVEQEVRARQPRSTH